MEGKQEELTATLKTRKAMGNVAPSGRRAPVKSDLGRRWNEARLVLSLAVFPGCAQLYSGQLARGILWSCLFLFVVLPLSFFLFFTWAFSESALFWVLIGLGTFLLLGGLGPALRAFRSPPLGRRARPSTRVVAAYACVMALAVVAESSWFLVQDLETVRVSSAYLEPLAREGETATILLSRFTRPVHGEVILFGGLSADRLPPEDDKRQCLGRVLAKPGDAVALQKGTVFVNGIRIQWERTDQRRSLEKAGRRIRRDRILTSLFSHEDDLGAVRDGRLRLSGEDWKLVLPKDVYLVVPDVDVSDRGSDGTRPIRGPAAWLVDRSDVLGRMIPRFPH